jgi:hypothetical protein
VTSIPNAIYFKTGVRPEEQLLAHCGKPLGPNMTLLSQTAIRRNSTVNLVIETK